MLSAADAALMEARRRGSPGRHRDGGHDVDVVAEPVGEQGPQRPVGEPAGQDGLLAGTTFAPEERTGDLARGVAPLFEVDGQREEIGAGTDRSCWRWR